MKYSQFRIALLTFSIGLVSVPFLTPYYDKWCEPSVDVPQVESESPVTVIVSTESHPFKNWGGGGGSGCMCGHGDCRCDAEFVVTKARRAKTKTPSPVKETRLYKKD